MTRSLFIFLFFSYLDLLQGKSVEKYYMTNIIHHSYISGCYSIILYDEYRRVVHRPYSSCISSIQNPIGTPSSSSCQLRLGV